MIQNHLWVCGSTNIKLKSRKAGDLGQSYWRCTSFRGKREMPNEGRYFIPHR